MGTKPTTILMDITQVINSTQNQPLTKLTHVNEKLFEKRSSFLFIATKLW